MLRLTGALLLFGGACRLGWQVGEERLGRTKNLWVLMVALERLRQELTFHLTPLPELLADLGGRTEGAVGAFLRRCGGTAGWEEAGFSSAWKRETQMLRGCLPDGALDCLTRLGDGLGRCGWEEQERLIDAVLHELEHCFREEQEEGRRRARLCRILGAAGGAMLVLWLL